MKQNMGSNDRLLRLLVAAVIGILYFTGVISGGTAVILGLIAVVFFFTSLAGYCPLYSVFGVSTRRKQTK